MKINRKNVAKKVKEKLQKVEILCSKMVLFTLSTAVT
jgi:hypothetical protein